MRKYLNLVNKYKKWIESVGGNTNTVHYIVKNHMRYNNYLIWPNKQRLKSNPNFDKLSKFSKHDRSGLDEQCKDYQMNQNKIIEEDVLVTTL